MHKLLQKYGFTAFAPSGVPAFMPTSDLSSKPPAAAPSRHSKPSASPSPESLSPPRRSRRVSNYRVCALEYNVDKLIVNNAFLLQYNIAPGAILNRLSLVSWLLKLCDQRKIQRDAILRSVAPAISLLINYCCFGRRSTGFLRHPLAGNGGTGGNLLTLREKSRHAAPRISGFYLLLLSSWREARAAESTPPWNERTTRLYQVIFPQMAHWLPDAEAEQLRSEFRTELERLKVLVHKS